MNIICVYIFNLLLFNSCLMASIDRNSSRSEIHNQSENQSQIDALNEDFLYPMFENSDLHQMLQFANDIRIWLKSLFYQ